MNHIFYLHSNTCVISSFDVISQLLSKDEKVIIISERNTKFPFFEGQITLYDMQKTIDKYRNNTHNVFQLAINYKISLMPHCEEVAKDIIDEQVFIFYTPSYNMYSIKPFLTSKYCESSVDYIQNKFKGIDLEVLPSSFSIETLMYHHPLNIYCIFGVYSLQLYALMLKSTPHMIVKEDYSVREIKDIPEFVDIATRDWDG